MRFSVKFTQTSVHIDGVEARAAELGVKVRRCASLNLSPARLGTGRAGNDMVAIALEAKALARLRAMKLCGTCRANTNAVKKAMDAQQSQKIQDLGITIYDQDGNRVVLDRQGFPVAWCRYYLMPDPKGDLRYIRTTGDRLVTTVPADLGVNGIDDALIAHAEAAEKATAERK